MLTPSESKEVLPVLAVATGHNLDAVSRDLVLDRRLTERTSSPPDDIHDVG